MAWLSNLSIKYKFLLIPLVTVIGLLAYLLFNMNAINNNSERLLEIREKNYPALEYANSNIVLFDRVSGLFSAAVSTDEIEMIDEAVDLYSDFKKNMSQLNSQDKAQVSDIQKIETQARDYFSLAKSLSNGMLEGTLDQGNIPRSVSQMNVALETLKSSLVKFKDERYSTFTNTLSEADVEAQNTLSVGLGIAIASILFMALTAYIVISMLNRNIQVVLNSLKNIAEGEGDLTRRIDQQSKDEIGELAFWVNSFLDKLQNTIGNVVNVIPALTKVSVDMAQEIKLTKDRAYEQSDSATQVADSVQNMISTGGDVAQHASKAAEEAGDANQTAKNGQEIVNKTVQSINNLASEVEQTAVVIAQLEQDTGNIDSILEVIKGVAEQTNLLALNAAIEAARAGENGRGFAVVADEVRTLASRTQESTQEIQTVIEKLQTAAQSAVNVMKTGQDQASQSVQQAEMTGDSLRAITDKVQSILTMNKEIATSTEAQQHSSESIHNHIITMSASAGKIVESSENIDGLSDDLANVSDQLQTICKQFKV
jgi:methyl-accepting chemotaxis protein